MKNIKNTILIFLTILLLIPLNILAQSKKEINKTFEYKKRIKIKLVLGDCSIKPSGNNQIRVNVLYTYDDDLFEAQFREKGNSVYIKEDLHGNNNGGYSKWTIYVPAKVEVDFETATGDLDVDQAEIEIDGNSGTGDLDIKDAKGEFDLNTGTGDITVNNSEGEFDLNSGTGEVNVEDTRGNFDLNSGTGDVEVKNITIYDEAELNSGTGDAEVIGPSGDDFDLWISSGTGDAVLKMNGKPLQGYFELSANSRRGDIYAPFDFDEENEYQEGDARYIRKSFSRDGKTPRYFISTGTGTAMLKE